MEATTIDEFNSYTEIDAVYQPTISDLNESEEIRTAITQERQQPQQLQGVMSEFRVSPELQMPLIVSIVLIGFLLILVFSSVSIPKQDQKVMKKIKDDNNYVKDDDDADGNDAPNTPNRKSSLSTSEVTGSILTPAGRRSARLRTKVN